MMGAAEMPRKRPLLPDPDQPGGGLMPGTVTPGNIDVSNRPKHANADGSTSTVYSASFGMDGGKSLLLPRIRQDGAMMSNQEALDEYRRTGEHLGIYRSQADADAASDEIHRFGAGRLRELTKRDMTGSLR